LVWTLDLGADVWRDGASREVKRALTSAIIDAETAERASTLPEPLPCATSLCNTDHPELLRVAARLRWQMAQRMAALRGIDSPQTRELDQAEGDTEDRAALAALLADIEFPDDKSM
jgi:hypothetical protein